MRHEFEIMAMHVKRNGLPNNIAT